MQWEKSMKTEEAKLGGKTEKKHKKMEGEGKQKRKGFKTFTQQKR